MQRPERQPAVRQSRVDRRNAERQHGAPPPRAAVNALNTLTKRFGLGLLIAMLDQLGLTRDDLEQ
jgi:hypothetical protein